MSQSLERRLGLGEVNGQTRLLVRLSREIQIVSGSGSGCRGVGRDQINNDDDDVTKVH